ncbi:MAG: CGNR zinc finger domain-containing protein [Chloroflexia bacterium]|nr:CGNR zinc finger domain-containing protein [Chloroflexia bacterium]
MQVTKTFDLDAGVDCLAFVNTLDDRGGERPTELLHEYADLVAFAVQAETLQEPEARRLTALAFSRPVDAAAVVSEAIILRELLYRIFSAVAAECQPDGADLQALNGELRAALGNVELDRVSDAIEWGWLPGTNLRRPLWPIVQSAAELLTSSEGGRVRECAAHDCEWLFFDESRNRSRRWCNMQTCGNRAKVDRFRARQRGAEIVETA